MEGLIIASFRQMWYNKNRGDVGMGRKGLTPSTVFNDSVKRGEVKTLKKDTPIRDYNPNLVKDAAKVDPLEDKAFKKLLSPKRKALSLLINKYVSGHRKVKVIDINGHILLARDSKEIMMDSLFELQEDKFINVEGQKVTADFPFKRHLAYWSSAYMHQLQRGVDYRDMLPAVSIVVYKNRNSSNWYDEARLQGSLAKEDDILNPLLQLVALNSNNWRAARQEEPELGNLLYLLHNGLDTTEEERVEAGIDTDSQEFKEIYDEVFFDCSSLRVEQHKEKGDEKMINEYKTVLEEWIEEGEARGREEGRGKGRGKGR